MICWQKPGAALAVALRHNLAFDELRNKHARHRFPLTCPTLLPVEVCGRRSGEELVGRISAPENPTSSKEREQGSHVLAAAGHTEGRKPPDGIPFSVMRIAGTQPPKVA
jgi:hypothetical protein